jgi:metal transporter CNNM
MTDTLIWLGIALCLSQSAMFSGLNLAVFSLSRLRLEAAAEAGDPQARRVLALRRNANFALTTILWGNVAINVLLTLLAESVLAGMAAFLFSTVVITLAGEIAPQAYFSRNALRVASLLAPVLRGYQVLLWPVAWPAAKLLDAWIGPEGMPWYRERELREVLEHHARGEGTEIGRIEATGAINFLSLDDLPVGHEGEPLDPRSVIQVPFRDGQPVFPKIKPSADDPFLRQLAASGRKWVVLTDERNEPRLVASAPNFIRAALFDGAGFNPLVLCHHPLIVRDASRPLGQVLGQLTVQPERPGDDVIDEDLILVWADTGRRIITGSDLLGRLLRRIARHDRADQSGLDTKLSLRDTERRQPRPDSP